MNTTTSTATDAVIPVSAKNKDTKGPKRLMKKLMRMSIKNKPNQYNMPTDKGFKIFIKTQFGDDITVYGLNEESTMLDIEKKLERKHGSSMSKSGIRMKPPKGIDSSLWWKRWGSKKDMKLKDLGIKANDTVIWSTVYTQYKSKLSDQVNDIIDAKSWNDFEATSYKVKISLAKILKKDANEIKMLGTLLQKRGWCLIQYPKDIKTIIDTVCKKVDKAIVKQYIKDNINQTNIDPAPASAAATASAPVAAPVTNNLDPSDNNNVATTVLDPSVNGNDDDNKTNVSANDNNDDDNKINDNNDDNWKQLLDGYGYMNFKDYKQVLRVLTGTLLAKFKDKYPKKLKNDITSISVAIDKLALDIINIIGTDANCFNFASMDEFNEKCKETDCNVTMINGFRSNNQIKCGLLDFAYYDNVKDKKKQSKYPMIKNNQENVGPHTDPGLFSLSFLSTAPGLQLYDITHDVWREVKNTWGVLWCGEAASTISNGKILSGIHRVVFNPNKPRFTSWYELSVDSQLTKAIAD